MFDLLFSQVCLVTMDEETPLIRRGYLGVSEGKIAYLGEEEPQEGAKRTIDGRGKVLMPGLINAHTHLGMTALRGYADDVRLHEWLHEHVFPVEGRMDAHAVYISTLLGLAEAIRFGTTSVSDMYMPLGAVGEAVREAGVKANLCNAITAFDREGFRFEKDGVYRQSAEALLTLHNADGGRIKLDMGIHAEYTSFDRAWADTARFAHEHGLNMHLHLSETEREHRACVEQYGRTPARLFEEAGVFENRTSCAHCVFVSDEDMDILRKHGATAVHNPVSNLKLGSGIARVPRMLELGLNVALGTDGVCSNNNLDLFEEIKLAALLAKGSSRDPALLPAGEALRLATRGGAYAQGREGECGMLRAGFDADLILLDFDQPHLTPVHHPISSLCYSARGSDVVMTMVRGRVLYENGEYPTLDLERINRTLGRDVMPRLFGA